MIDQKVSWIKYLSPFFGILFCPVTILFFWSIWSSPTVDSETEVASEIQSVIVD